MGTLAVWSTNSGVDFSSHIPCDDTYGLSANDPGDALLVTDATKLSHHKSFCPIQKVTEGTGAALYQLVSHQFQCVGAKSWEDACNQHANLRRVPVGVALVAAITVMMYTCCFDAAGDN